MEDKIIQIIPAPTNLRTVYQDEGEEIISKVLCIALRDNGEVSLIDISSDGLIDDPETIQNYEGIKWGD